MKRLISTTWLQFADWYADDAVFVGGGGGSGPHYGRQSIEKRMALEWHRFPKRCHNRTSFFR
jgi:hypothetical protein